LPASCRRKTTEALKELQKSAWSQPEWRRISMKKRIILVSLFFGVVFLVTAAIVPALTNESQYEEFQVNGAVTIYDCGEFVAELIDDIKGSYTTFFDQDGNPTAFQAHVEFLGTVTNSKTGASFMDYASVSFSGELPLDEKSETVRGVSDDITVPGRGIVALRVGKLIQGEDGNLTYSVGESLDRTFADALCEEIADL